MSRDLWIVTYDIACPKRWRRVFKLLKSYGKSVQYSVFECRLSKAQAKALQASLASIVHVHDDRVHCYPLCGQCDRRAVILGSGARVEDLPVAGVVSDAAGDIAT